MRVFKYELGDELTVNKFAEIGMPAYIGRKGTVNQQIGYGSFDYELDFGDGVFGRFKESELDGVVMNNTIKFKNGDNVKTSTEDEWSDRKGIVVGTEENDSGGYFYNVVFNDANEMWCFDESELELVEEIEKQLNNDDFSMGEQLLDLFLSQYENKDNTYTVPRQLLIKILDNMFEEA